MIYQLNQSQRLVQKIMSNRVIYTLPYAFMLRRLCSDLIRSNQNRVLCFTETKWCAPKHGIRSHVTKYARKVRFYKKRTSWVKNVSTFSTLREKLISPTIHRDKYNIYFDFTQVELQILHNISRNHDVNTFNSVIQTDSEIEEQIFTSSEHGDIPEPMLHSHDFSKGDLSLHELNYESPNFPNLQKIFESDFWRTNEATYLVIQTLKKARDVEDIVLALSQFWIAFTKKSIASLALNLFDKASELIAILTQNNDGEVQSDYNPFIEFRKIISSTEQHWSHPLLIKLRSLFHYLLSYSILDKMGITYDQFWFSKAEVEASKKQHSSKYGFVMSILDGTSYILERIYDCYLTNSWSPLLHNASSYGRWADDIFQIKEDAMKMHNPGACGVEYHSYIERIRVAVEQGENIIRYAQDLDRSAVVTVKRLLSEVRLIEANELTKKAARQTREAPFSFLLYGGSSLGKSTLADLLFYAMANIHNLPSGDEYRYTRCFSDEYYSGFTSAVWFMVLDDIAARHPDLKDDPSMNEIIQIINNTAFVPPQADLADKGKTPLRPKFVMGTTNQKQLNAMSYYCNTLSISRRFNYTITVTVRPEFSTRPRDNGFMRMLDPSKMPAPNEGIPDAWLFDVEKVEAACTGNTQTPKFVCIHPQLNIHQLIAFLAKESAKHFEIQNKVMMSRQLYQELNFCKVCFAVSDDCKCEDQELNFCDVCSAVLDDCECEGQELNVCEVCFAVSDFCYCEAQTTYASEICDVALKAACITTLCCVSLAAYRASKWFNNNSPSSVVREIVVGSVKDCVSNTLNGVVAPIKKRIDTPLNYLQKLRENISCQALTFEEKVKLERENVVRYFSDLGSRIQSQRLKHPLIRGLVLTLPVILAGWTTYRLYFNKDSVQTSWEEGGRIETKDEKPNPWYRDEYEPDEFQIGRLTSSWKNLPHEQVIKDISSNCFNCIVRSKAEDVRRADCRVLCLIGHLYVTNAHAFNFRTESLELTIAFRPADSGLGAKFVYTVFERDCFFLKDRDLVFFCLDSVPPRKRLIDLFPSSQFKTVCNGIQINRDEKGIVNTQSVRGIKHGECPLFSPPIPCVYGTSERNTVRGDCGSTLVGFTPSGPVILGIHVQGGANNIVGSSRIYREDIDQAMLALNASEIQSSIPFLEDLSGKPIAIGELHHKSTFRYIEEGVCTVYGSLEGFRPKNRSKVVDTCISQSMQARGYEVETGAPEMRGWRPWRKGALDIVGQVFNVSRADVRACVDAFAHDVISSLPAHQFKEMLVLDNDATLNGLPGVKFIDKMNRKTSMGFPWRKKKSCFLSAPCLFEEWKDYVKFDDYFYERVDRIIDTYRSGCRHMPVYIQHLKDEPRALEKIVDGNTRVFGGAPADWSFVMRKYLLSFVRVVQNNKFIFEAAPGTNTTSYEWDELYHYLTQFGTDRNIAGDFAKYDKRMSGVWILAAFQFIIKILKHAGWPDADIIVILGLAEDVAFPLCDFNGDLVEFWGSNPSGHPLTVIINCIAHSLYMRYVWLKVGLILGDFKTYVALMTYGDDDVLNVSAEITTYDHTVIQRELGKIGVKYTMADKESNSVPFLNMSDIVFLQRAWRYDEEIGSHMAALNEKSISKMLTKYIPSKVVCPEQHGVDILQNALREYFFHGREVFEEHRIMFLEVIEENKLECFFTSFPTYDDFKQEYIDNSIDVWPTGRCPHC